MNRLEKRLNDQDSILYGKLIDCREEVKLLLQKYSSNFPQFTDHSSEHTIAVSNLASDILSDNEINSLNSDEVYVLLAACYLHDVGMCVSQREIRKIENSSHYSKLKERNPEKQIVEYITQVWRKNFPALSAARL